MVLAFGLLVLGFLLCFPSVSLTVNFSSHLIGLPTSLKRSGLSKKVNSAQFFDIKDLGFLALQKTGRFMPFISLGLEGRGKGEGEGVFKR